MVGGCVDEDSTLVPRSTLHSDVLMDVAQTLQLTVADHDGWGKKKRARQMKTLLIFQANYH